MTMVTWPRRRAAAAVVAAIVIERVVAVVAQPGAGVSSRDRVLEFVANTPLTADEVLYGVRDGPPESGFAERLAVVESDPTRLPDWRRDRSAQESGARARAAGEGPDDPYWVHTDAYDAAQRIELDAYNALFDDELGTGGWDTINRAHYAHIERVLDPIAARARAS